MLKIKIAFLATVVLLIFSCNTKSKEEKTNGKRAIKRTSEKTTCRQQNTKGVDEGERERERERESEKKPAKRGGEMQNLMRGKMRERHEIGGIYRKVRKS